MRNQVADDQGDGHWGGYLLWLKKKGKKIRFLIHLSPFHFPFLHGTNKCEERIVYLEIFSIFLYIFSYQQPAPISWR